MGKCRKTDTDYQGSGMGWSEMSHLVMYVSAAKMEHFRIRWCRFQFNIPCFMLLNCTHVNGKLCVWCHGYFTKITRKWGVKRWLVYERRLLCKHGNLSPNPSTHTKCQGCHACACNPSTVDWDRDRTMAGTYWPQPTPGSVRETVSREQGGGQ